VESAAVVILAILVFLFAIFSGRLARSPVSGPMLFVTAGILLGSAGLSWVTTEVGDGIMQFVLEITLALVLFTDATDVSLRTLRDEVPLSSRLLGIGMPITMVVGGGLAAVLFTDLEFWEGMLVGVMLAPTDAALGQAVVANRRVPARIRQALTVESGLNDGLALPIFSVVLAIAEVEFEASPRIFIEIGVDLVIAIAAGVIVGYLAGVAMAFATERGWVGDAWRSIGPAAVAIGLFAATDLSGLSGFIAAFVGGIFFGHATRERVPGVAVFSEGAAHLLTMLSFFVFGAAIFGPIIGDLTWPIVGYALLSLTIIRMVPVALSLIGTDLEWRTVGYLGWFGPRGLASIVFMTILVLEAELPGKPTMVLVVAATVALSVYLHGATAWWGSNHYASWYESMGKEMEDMTESGAVSLEVRRSRLEM